MLTRQQLDELEKSYTSEEPPPCRVCGAELTLADSGGRFASAKYACSSEAASMMRAKGREAYASALDHYRQSQWQEPFGGDTRVVGLIRAYRELLESGPAAELRSLREEVARDPRDLIAFTGASVMERVLRAIDSHLAALSALTEAGG